MQPIPNHDDPASVDGPSVDVGAFRQGSPLSQWALARYLVGRAVAEALGAALWLVGALVLVAAGLLWWRHVDVPAVLLAVFAVGVLLLRAVLMALLRRLTTLPGADREVAALVRQTRGEVLRELRRLGLPGHTATLPLLALRLLRSRSRERSLAQLRAFDIHRVVPAARLDELHLLLGKPGSRR